MVEYVPTNAEMREYVVNGGEYRPWDAPDLKVEERRGAAWDRWLAAHDATVKAEALREAAREWQTGGWANDLPQGGDRPALILGMSQRACNWLRARADQIEAES